MTGAFAKCWIIKYYICHFKVKNAVQKEMKTHMKSQSLWVTLFFYFFAIHFTFSFAYFLFIVVYCCRFAIIESLPFEFIFFYLPLTQKNIYTYYTTHFIAHTLWWTLRMQLYILFFLSHCFDFFCVCVCSSTSYFLSSYFYLCGFLYVSNIKKPAYSFDAFPVYNLQIREKEWKKNEGKQERGEQPLTFYVF